MINTVKMTKDINDMVVTIHAINERNLKIFLNLLIENDTFAEGNIDMKNYTIKIIFDKLENYSTFIKKYNEYMLN